MVFAHGVCESILVAQGTRRRPHYTPQRRRRPAYSSTRPIVIVVIVVDHCGAWNGGFHATVDGSGGRITNADGWEGRGYGDVFASARDTETDEIN